MAVGAIFFFILVFANVFSITISENVFVMNLLGLFILFYALLAFYYLKYQRISLNELIFLSTFMAVLDILVLTIFVYFSGGPESIFVIAYFLFLAFVPFWSPYLPFAPFFWSATAALLYDLMLLLIGIGRLPFLSYGGVKSLNGHVVSNLINQAILITLMLIGFALTQYYVLKVMKRERLETEKELSHEKDVEKQYAAFSSIFWVLTHILKVDEMLGQALAKLLEILGLKSGMILLVDSKKGVALAAQKDVPEEIINSLKGKKPSEISALFSSLTGIFLGKEFIQKEFIRKLVFHRKMIGYLILFSSRGEEIRVTAELNSMLDAVADEMAAAVYYGRLMKGVRLK